MALPLSDLLRETARLFGFTRRSTTLEPTLLRALEQLVEQGRAERDGDNVSLPRDA